MSVNLSAFAGAGWQFFNDNGDPLTGGKLYTYAAGTTTPAVTYTSQDGGTAHSNPIILDAAGRVADEIWLTSDATYKFQLKDANDVLIGTYDNIYGVVGADIPGTVNVENFTGNGTQTTFILSAPPGGVNNTQVFINGVYQFKNTYAVSGSTLTFTQAPPPAASKIEVLRFSTFSVGTLNADQVIYDPAGTGAVATTVQAKLRETVSVKDFGAVGDGVTDDTVAFQAALDYSSSNQKAIFVPQGVYLITDELTYTNQYYPCTIYGENLSGETTNSPRLEFNGSFTNGLLVNGTMGSQGCDIRYLEFRKNPAATISNGLNIQNLRNPRVIACRFLHFDSHGIYFTEETGIAETMVIGALVEKCYFNDCFHCISFQQTVSGQSNTHTIESCSFYGSNSGIRFETTFSNNVRILNNIFEAISGDDIFFQQVVTCLIQGNYFESNAFPSKSVYINFWQGQPGVYFDAITVASNNFQGGVLNSIVGASQLLGFDAFSNHYAGIGNKPFLRITAPSGGYNNLNVERPTKYGVDVESLTYTVETLGGEIAVNDKVFKYRRASKGEATAIATFDGTSAIGVDCNILYSQNVTSVSHNNTGDYTITFAYPLEAAEFSSTFGTTASGTPCVAMLHASYVPSMTTVRVSVRDLSGTPVDNARISVVIHNNF